MKASYLKLFFATAVCFSFAGCADNNEGVSRIDAELNTEILENFSASVAQSSYNNLKTEAADLYTSIEALAGAEGKTADNLQACQQNWRDARAAWEQTESFLFGPVSTEDVDPRIDTWPVDFNVLQDLLESENEFTESFIDGLEEGQKGFHAIEYLIFGEEGNKVPEDFTARELEYLTALGQNLKKLTTEVAEDWSPDNSESFHYEFISAGHGSLTYETQQDAFNEVVASMAGICDEVANAKMGEVLLDINGEESPFSKNSLFDFQNNMQGVLNVYQAKGIGTSLEDLVRKHDLSLDSKIKTTVNAAITALINLDEDGKTFEQITDEKPLQVQAAIDTINELQLILDDGDNTVHTDLAGFILQHTK